MMNWFRLTGCILIVTGIISCHNNKGKSVTQKLSQEQLTEKLVEANKNSIEIENKQIDTLISNSGWKMLETKTGLRYQVLEKGSGPIATSGKIVRFDYEVMLLDGKMIYNSKQTGPKEFLIGSGGVESGLEEGILLLKVGDKVRFIIPSYLAHGLSGDQNLIPPKSTLIYSVKLLELK